MSTTAQTATDIRPFHVDIPEEKLAELRRRIAATRLPSRELVADRSQGVQLATIQELARYWETDYDWRKAEAKLNALPQFTTEIDGVDIHFIHVKSSHENALPLIMTHGWPGSVMEMIDSVGPLTDPTAHGGSAEDAFHLVLPSLPGYGFSGEPVEVGWDLGRTARAWAELMRRLGYTRYVAQGGDVGAGVTDAMGRQAPEGLIGIHTNLLVPALSGTMPTDTDEERAAAAQIATFRQSGNGYFVEMATRPQTIGYALLDSPVALAAWMIDHDTDAYYKIARAFVDGQPSGNLTRDNVLDNITAVLADRHRRLRGPVVLGGLRAGRAGRGPPAAAAAADPGRLHDVPRRDLADSAQLGRDSLPERHLLQRGRPGRPLRRLGGAGALLRPRCGPRSGHCARKEAVMTTHVHPGRARLGLRRAEPPRRVRRHVHQPVRRHRRAAPARGRSAATARRCCSIHGWPQTWYAWRMLMPRWPRTSRSSRSTSAASGCPTSPRDGYDIGTLAERPRRADGRPRPRAVRRLRDATPGCRSRYALAADHPERVERLVVSGGLPAGHRLRAAALRSRRRSTPASGTSCSTSSRAR